MSTETPTLDRTREQLKSTEPDMTRIFLSIALNIKIKLFHYLPKGILLQLQSGLAST